MQWHQQLSVSKIYPVQLSKQKDRQSKFPQSSSNIVYNCPLQSYAVMVSPKNYQNIIQPLPRPPTEILHISQQKYFFNLENGFLIYDMQYARELLDISFDSQIISETVISKSRLFFIDSSGAINILDISRALQLAEKQNQKQNPQQNSYQKYMEKGTTKICERKLDLQLQQQELFPYINKGKLIPTGFSQQRNILILPTVKGDFQQLKLIDVEEQGIVGNIVLDSSLDKNSTIKGIFGNQSRNSLSIYSSKAVYIADLRTNRIVLGKGFNENGNGYCTHMQPSNQPYQMFFSVSNKINLLDFRNLSNETQIFKSQNGPQGLFGVNHINQFQFTKRQRLEDSLVITLENRPIVSFYTRKHQN